MSLAYYDRQGHPITDRMAWAKQFEDITYRLVRRTVLSNGRVVSTIWLGLNHQFGDGPPLIFETMVFPNEDDLMELTGQRYTTEADAIAGHNLLCEKWEAEP